MGGSGISVFFLYAKSGSQGSLWTKSKMCVSYVVSEHKYIKQKQMEHATHGREIERVNPLFF